MSLPAWDGLGQKVPYRQVMSVFRHGLSMPEVGAAVADGPVTGEENPNAAARRAGGGLGAGLWRAVNPQLPPSGCGSDDTHRDLLPRPHMRGLG